MRQVLGSVALLVRDYDEAIAYFTGVLGFTLREDTPVTADKRWVRITPPGSTESGLLLARARTPAEHAAVGNQAGGRVMFFLHTDDFARDHAAFRARGVSFTETPRHETYGQVAVFTDLYGNRWDLVQLKQLR